MSFTKPSEEWLIKMAALEDGKCVSVGGLAVEMGLYQAEPIKVGDRVRILKDIYEGCDDLPPDLLARRGEVLFVRRVKCGEYAWSVAHSMEMEGSFVISRSEFEPACEPTQHANRKAANGADRNIVNIVFET